MTPASDAPGRYVIWQLDFAGVRTSGEFLVPSAPATDPLDWTIVGPR